MKEIFKYIFIGFIQGLTEFLPISSSGHIVLFGSLFNLDNLLLLSIMAHFGTLFAVIYCYRKKLKEMLVHPFCDTNKKLVLATIPTILIFLVFNKFFTESFSVKTLIWGFLVSAFLLLVADLKKEENKPLLNKTAIYMGLSQGLALLPGISRSGSTLVCGLLTGTNKEETLEFSFLMSIPVILGSGIYESFNLFSQQISVSPLGIFLVLISSFIFGILSIKIMLKLVKNNKLFYFSFYLILLSLGILIFY